MASLDELKKKYLKNNQTEQKTQTTSKSTKSTTSSGKNDGSGSYLEKLKKKYIPTIDQDYISSFASDVDSYISSAESDYKSMSVENSSAVHDSRLERANDLSKRSFAIRQYIEKNRNALGEEQYNSFKSYLDEFDKASSDLRYDFYNANKYYSGEKEKYDINNLSSREIAKYLSGDDAIAYTTSDGKNVTWQSLYDKKVKEEKEQALYSSISSKSDFRDAVRAAIYFNNPEIKQAEKGKSVVNKVSYYEANADMIAIGEANGGGSNIVHSRIGFMTDREKEIYNYYFGIGDYEQADAYPHADGSPWTGCR